MTLIEFFEKDAVENICSCLTKTPDKVILIGGVKTVLEDSIPRYKEVLRARGADVVIEPRTVNRNNLQTVVETLSEIVESNEDCVFDLTGGDDLYLVAAGIVFEKYKEKNIQMHRFNIRNNTIIDCDQDGNTIMEGEAPQLSVEENIKIYGGDVVYDDQREDRTYRWDMNDDFKKDINVMWNICRRDPGKWNVQINVLAAAERINTCPAGSSVTADMKKLEDMCEFVYFHDIMFDLRSAGLISNVRHSKNEFAVTYKNEQVRYCLTVCGQILEMKIYLAACEAHEKNGKKTYNDVMTGVYIDWDGKISDKNSCDTENEVDVMMMHGMVPVFVSCKNGRIDKEELYKLSSVAGRFGGKYAKKVLFAAALDDSDYSKYIRQRAEDMEIRLIEGAERGEGKIKSFRDMNDAELNRIIRSLWSN